MQHKLPGLKQMCEENFHGELNKHISKYNQNIEKRMNSIQPISTFDQSQNFWVDFLKSTGILG